MLLLEKDYNDLTKNIKELKLSLRNNIKEELLKEFNGYIKWFEVKSISYIKDDKVEIENISRVNHINTMKQFVFSFPYTKNNSIIDNLYLYLDHETGVLCINTRRDPTYFIEIELQYGTEKKEKVEQKKEVENIDNLIDKKYLEVPKNIKGEDWINHPKHYTFGKYEVIDVIEDWNLPYHLSNVIKYIARCEYKGKKIEDLKKAKFYLDRYIELLEKKEIKNENKTVVN